MKKVNTNAKLNESIRNNLGELKLDELKKMLRAMDLKVSGTKDEIIGRILEHVQNPKNPKDIPSKFIPQSTKNDLTIREINALTDLMTNSTGKRDSIIVRINEYIGVKTNNKFSPLSARIPLPVTLIYGILLDIGYEGIEKNKLCQISKIKSICNDDVFWKLMIRKDCKQLNFYGKLPSKYKNWKQYYLDKIQK